MLRRRSSFPREQATARTQVRVCMRVQMRIHLCVCVCERLCASSIGHSAGVAVAVYSKHGSIDAHLQHTHLGCAYFGSVLLRVTRPSSHVTQALP